MTDKMLTTNDIKTNGSGVRVATEEGRTEARPYMGKEGTARHRENEQGPVGHKKEKRRQAAALHKKIDGVEIWKQFEDLLAPRLRLTVVERAVYSHLVRHSRLEGKQRLRFSIAELTRASGLSQWILRKGIGRLACKGVLRLRERGRRGHTIEVRLPEEIRALRAAKMVGAREGSQREAPSLRQADFLEKRALREAIHEREGGRCFYCLRRTAKATRCVDHVIPRVRLGSNSYCNLVSSCAECNSRKRERGAADFLRWLYREGRLEGRELKERLKALERLAAGELRPAVNGGTGTGVPG